MLLIPSTLRIQYCWRRYSASVHTDSNWTNRAGIASYTVKFYHIYKVAIFLPFVYSQEERFYHF